MTQKNTDIKTLFDRLFRLVEKEPPVLDGLSMGRTSLILLYFYYGRYANDDEISSKGYNLIQEIFSNTSTDNEGALKTADFFNGYCGFLSVLSNLKQNSLLEINYEDLNDLDTMICDWGAAQFREGNTDFFYGGAGCLHYFISRNQVQADSCFIDRLIESLQSLFTTNKDTFGIINDYYNKADGRHHKEINFSLAHGMSSIILCLTRLWAKGYRTYGIHTYAARSIEYMLQITDQSTIPAPYSFSAAINLESQKAHCQSRLGWCYSDLNILQLLFEAGKVFDRKDWTERAKKAAAVVSGRRNKEHTLVEDAFVCHGSAGLYQYYTKLNELNEAACFREAADYWIKDAVAYFGRTTNKYFKSPAYLEKGHIHSLFYGPLGVALCLLSCLDKKSSNWSSIIML